MTGYIGLDLGGTFIKAGLVDQDGNIVLEKQIPTQVGQGAEVIVENLLEMVRLIQDDMSEDMDIPGVGIGAPGCVKVSEGIYVEGPNLPDWKDFPVASILSEKLELSVVVDNDANMAALGEYTYGAGQGCTDMMMVTLGTGVGSGLILDGKLYRGVHDTAGEFGHTTIQFEGPVCNCGRKGCVEAYIGTNGILAVLKAKLEAGRSSVLKEMVLDKIMPKDIGMAAKKGDELAIEVLHDVGYALGIGFGNIANLLNLERIVVGGGVAAAGDFILEPARKGCREMAMKVQGETLQIVPASLGNKAGFIGAACLAMLNSQ